MPIKEQKVLDSAFARASNLHVRVTVPFKRTIEELAAQRGVSTGDIVREALQEYLAMTYPQYNSLYERFKAEEYFGQPNSE